MTKNFVFVLFFGLLFTVAACGETLQFGTTQAPVASGIAQSNTAAIGNQESGRTGTAIDRTIQKNIVAGDR